MLGYTYCNFLSIFCNNIETGESNKVYHMKNKYAQFRIINRFLCYDRILKTFFITTCLLFLILFILLVGFEVINTLKII